MVLLHPAGCLQTFLELDQGQQLAPRTRRKRKHVPHRLRSQEFVRRRNSRERRRVRIINAAFESLRHRVPRLQQDAQASKISILRQARLYILSLTSFLNAVDGGTWAHQTATGPVAKAKVTPSSSDIIESEGNRTRLSLLNTEIEPHKGTDQKTCVWEDLDSERAASGDEDSVPCST